MQSTQKKNLHFSTVLAVFITMTLSTVQTATALAMESEKVAAPPRILLTGFAPYGDSERNSSFDVAKKMIEQHNTVKSTDDALKMSENAAQPYELFLCPEVPNSFENAAAHVLDCVKLFKPDYVISLGESPYCSIVVETQAANIYGGYGEIVDGTLYDSFRKIDETAENWKPLTLPFEAMYTAYRSNQVVDDDFMDVIIGNTEGNGFICNKLAYDLETILSPMNIPYGFIHIPNYDCASKIHSTSWYHKILIERLHDLFLALNKTAPLKIEAIYEKDYQEQNKESFAKADEYLKNAFSIMEARKVSTEDFLKKLQIERERMLAKMRETNFQ